MEKDSLLSIGLHQCSDGLTSAHGAPGDDIDVSALRCPTPLHRPATVHRVLLRSGSGVSLQTCGVSDAFAGGQVARLTVVVPQSGSSHLSWMWLRFFLSMSVSGSECWTSVRRRRPGIRRRQREDDEKHRNERFRKIGRTQDGTIRVGDTRDGAHVAMSDTSRRNVDGEPTASTKQIGTTAAAAGENMDQEDGQVSGHGP